MIIFNLDFLPVIHLPGIEVPTDWMDFGETSKKLEKLGFNSKSTFVNNVAPFLTLILLLSFNIFLRLIPCFNNQNHENKIMKGLSVAKAKILENLKYVAYVRFTLEAHEAYMISSTIEMSDFLINSAPTTISQITAWTLFTFCIVVPCIAFYLFLIARKEFDPKKKNIFGEFFEGIKNNKWARIYLTGLLLRRIAFVCIIIFISGIIHRNLIFYSLVFIQLVYCSELVSCNKIPFHDFFDFKTNYLYDILDFLQAI